MIYLSAGEYENYGLQATTPLVWVASASALIEAHCRRLTLGVSSYTERLRLPGERGVVRLTYLPLVAQGQATSPLVSARGRFGWPRRGEQHNWYGSGLGYEASVEVLQAFALPGTWTAVDPASIDYCAETGELTLPMNALGFSFNELEVTYTAGLATVPNAVKFACAQIARNGLATPALTVKSGTLDRMHLEYFASTLLDNDVVALLAPYVAQKVA